MRDMGMISRIWQIAVLMFLTSSAYCFSYSATMDGSGYSAQISSPPEDEFVAVSALDSGSLSNTIRGRGALHENHFVQGAGVTAQVRADIINSENYTYSYELIPDPRRASNAQEVQASQSLDVSGATYIKAAAIASARDLYSSASTEVIFGSLSGYTNKAVASASSAEASQKFDGASGRIETSSTSEHIKDGVWQRSNVITFVDGYLTEYNLTAGSAASDLEIIENSHIVGSFSSNAVAGNQSCLRTSNFGNQFDLVRYASLGSDSGVLTRNVEDSQAYYVYPGDKIQDAIDVASSGDTINVQPGIYNETLKIRKSLTIQGSGGRSTIIDAGRNGSVISIKPTPHSSSYPRFKLNLNSLTIKNGSSSWGGGIFIGESPLSSKNTSVNVESCDISNNSAFLGGGIYVGSVLSLKYTNIRDNCAVLGGGIFNKGMVVLDCCNIFWNSASSIGGGVCNEDYGTLLGDPGVFDNTPDDIRYI